MKRYDGKASKASGSVCKHWPDAIVADKSQ